jgi:hypothetical protein
MELGTEEQARFEMEYLLAVGTHTQLSGLSRW